MEQLLIDGMIIETGRYTRENVDCEQIPTGVEGHHYELLSVSRG
jgi:hypothetical protein